MATVWEPCRHCNGNGGFSVQDARGNWVNMQCRQCTGQGGKWVNV